LKISYRAAEKLFIILVGCYLLIACTSLPHRYRSADCDIVRNAEEAGPLPEKTIVSGTVGKGEPRKGNGWSVREPVRTGVYSIEFDRPFPAVPTCCVETQGLSPSRLSVEVIPRMNGLNIEASHGAERCLNKQRKVNYGYVVEETCTRWEMVHEAWNGHLKFTCSTTPPLPTH
jgi:hypothetical protein